MEADEDGVTAKNTYGGPLLLRTEFENDGVETTYQYMYNAHGDVVTLLMDGTVVATYYYDSFGNILDQTGEVSNSILYAGYQYDEETGLYYINARMYDPVTARFLQADTYLGNTNDPLSLNLYTYCLNNPQKYVDPSGHSVLLAFLLVTAVSGLLGAGMEYVSQKYIEKRDVINYDLILFEGVFNAVIGAASMGMASVGATAVRQAGKLTVRTVARTVVTGVAFGAAEGAIENVGRQMVTGASLNNLDYGEIASSAGFTGVIGGMGAAAGVGLDALKQARAMRKLTSGAKGKIADAANVLKGRNTGRYFRELDLQFFAGDEVLSGSKANQMDIRAYRHLEDSKVLGVYEADSRLIVDMPYNGKRKNTSNSQGWLRDNAYYWNEILERHPDAFSSSNRDIILGKNPFTSTPINDKTFRQYFPQYDVEGLRGKPLIHHHIGGGGQAFGMPSSLHIGSGGVHNTEKIYGIWGVDSDYAERLQIFLE